MTIHLPKVNQFGGGNGGGGGSSSFPTIVTDSGSSLPASSGYQLNDTFLNTTDKKIYKTLANIYFINSAFNYFVSDNLLNITTGVLDFNGGEKSLVINSYSNSSYKLVCPFIATDIENTQCILQGHSVSGYPTNYYNVMISIGKLFYGQSELCDIEINKPYIIEVVVTASPYSSTRSGTIKVYTEEGTKIAEETVTYNATEINIRFGSYYQPGPTSSFFTGKILPYNIGDYTFKLGDNNIVLIDTSTLNWDNGTSLTEGQYVDKTNGALYLYENSELVKIGGSLTKKVYTISADNTSILDVSSDFTKIVDVLKNGVELALTDDYTISSGVITFVTALSTTDKITVKGE